MQIPKCILLVLLTLVMSIVNCTAKQHKAVKTDSLTIFMAKGDSCVDSYDYYHASIFYQKAHAVSMTPETMRKLANVHHHMGRDKDCIRLLKEIPADSINYNDLRALFFAYKSLNDKDSLLLYGDCITRINPYDSEIVVSMAIYCNERNIPDKAISICQNYLHGDSLNLLVKRQLGYAFYLSGYNKEALDIYKELESKGFTNYESALIIGLSLKETDNAGEAYDYLLRAAKYKDFKDFTSLYNLGKVCNMLGLSDEAIDYTKNAISLLMPDSARMYALHTELAEAYFNIGNYKDAAKQFELSAQFKPDTPITYYNIAQMYGTVGNEEKVRENLTLFLEKSSSWEDNDEHHDMLEKAKEQLRAIDAKKALGK